jgi:hypothetical protein
MPWLSMRHYAIQRFFIQELGHYEKKDVTIHINAQCLTLDFRPNNGVPNGVGRLTPGEAVPILRL